MNDAYDLPLDPSDRTPWTVDLGGIHVVFGEGTLERLGAETAALGIRRALLVTDAGLEKAGHADRAIESLRRAGVAVRVYDGVEENPTTEHVGRGVAEAHAHGADGLIGLGGGSSMDCAKAVNFLFTNGRSMADYQGVDKATRPMLPSLGVPTTTGTGSEAQRFALISDPATLRKMACGDRKARFRTVVLDPELVSTMPRRVAATTAIDAVSHALESYVTRRRNPISQLYSREAWRLLESSFEAFLADPHDRGARGRMLLGAHLGGAAIEASMLGAAHSCANPLTARYGVTHGVAVGLMLPHVIRFNGAAVDELYGELALAARLNGGGVTHAERVSARVGELLAAAGLPARLRDCGVDADRLDALAAEAADQWTARFNPRAVAAGELRELYASAY